MRSADMVQQPRIFKISGNNMGLVCPFVAVHYVCQVGYCLRCSVYANWQKKGEFLVMCAWCGGVLRRDPDHGKPEVSHGICPECVSRSISPEAKVLIEWRMKQDRPWAEMTGSILVITKNYHAVCMAIVGGAELYYIEPANFLIRLGSYIP